MKINGLPVSSLKRGRASVAKRAFTTRRVPVDDMRTLISGSARPNAGDLVLASVDQIGKQTRLELISGRRARMFPGDEIIVCFGNRYAPDQFEAIVGPDLSGCDLVAAGGLAAREVSRHERMIQPTRISPIGLIGDANGTPLNVRDYAIPLENIDGPITTLLVAGTSMNSGKTLTSASIVRGLKAKGHRVAAIKATGTGAGGDLWIMWDVGADVVVDFTDAGFASTYKAPIDEIEHATLALIQHAARAGCSHAVIEIADGLQQQETAALLRSAALKLRSIGVVFAAYDAMGAKAGVDSLTQIGHRVLAVSGRLTRSPLAVREAEQSIGCPVFTPWQLQEGALMEALTERSSARDGSIPDIGYNSDRAVTANGIAHSEPSENTAAINFDREMLGFVANRLMELEIEGLCSADRGKRNPDRRNRRNGYRPRTWKTRDHMVDLRIPRLRKDSYFPAFLKPRTAAEQALWTVVLEARTGHVPTRSVDELVKAMGMAHVPDNKVSRLCMAVQEKLQALLPRPIEGAAQQRTGHYAGPHNGNGDFGDGDFGHDDFDGDVEDRVNGFEQLGNHRASAFYVGTSQPDDRATETKSSDGVGGAADVPLPAG